ncbi:unnamed protein product [Larinioides sclopetarius]|uniref:TOM1-like protein 2 n=1 Tax=Larinioides sclopetarius TaxID=280406 RepID=A0AAV2BFH7_9ARAC
MAGLLATLGGNPLNTPVGQKIEQATDGALPSENWALNMEICDMINDTDEGPKDAVKAIRKRLQQNTGKNYTVVLYTLTVLETCVKNCKRRFHLLVMQKDFILELVKLIGPKNDPPTAVQEKVLSLIQSWADAFQGNPEMQGVVQVYHDLKQKGIEFPMTDLDTMAPIHTPQRTVLLGSSPPKVVSDQTGHGAQSLHSNPNQMPDVLPPQAVPINLSPEQLAKLRSELDIVQGNMKVLGEMLTELTPGKEHPQDLELLQELQKTCYAMQNRIVDLIDRIGVEEVTNDLLRINDELNNLFLRYDRYEKKRTAMTSSIENKAPTPLSENPLDKPLIDFGESGEEGDQAAAKLTNLSLQDPSGSDSKNQNVSKNSSVADEFDMFAQSRNTTFGASRTRGSSYEDNTNLDQIEGGLASFTANKGKPMEAGDSRSDTKANCDPSNFANGKNSAVAGDRLPNLPSVPGTNPQSANNRRQMDKDDADSALFAL